MKRYLFIILGLVLSWSAYAQKLSVLADKAEITIDENVEITWTLDNATGKNFTAPNLSSFMVLSGPNLSTNVQMYNGSITQSESYAYLLKPKSVGKFTIGNATIQTRKGRLTSPTITITVKKGNPNGNAPNTSNNAGNADIFLKLTVDKQEVVVGEPVLITYKLYYREIELRDPNVLKFPSLKAFWVEDLTVSKSLNNQYEMVNGKRYVASVIKKSVIYPQKSGKLLIDPYEVEVTGFKRHKLNINRFFNDPFFNDPFDDQPFSVSLQSNAINLKVNPLPEANQPADFSGLAGRFSLQATVNTKKIGENEPLTYKLTLTGEGNFSQISPFKLPLPKDWDSYDPQTTDNIDRSGEKLEGAKTFEYTLTPQKMGKYTLSPVQFSYYDIDKKQYVTLSSPSFDIEVEKGTHIPTNINKPRAGEGQETKDKGWISNIASSPIFWSAVGVPVLLLIVLAYRKRKSISDTPQDSPRKNIAEKTAKSHLKTAKALMEAGKDQDFYSEIIRALYDYLHGKLGLTLSEINHEKIATALSAAGTDSTTTQSFIDILHRCEYGKYAKSPENRSSLYSDAVALVRNIEDKW